MRLPQIVIGLFLLTLPACTVVSHAQASGTTQSPGAGKSNDTGKSNDAGNTGTAPLHPGPGSNYVLQSGDVIEILVRNHEDLNQAAVVGLDGNILVKESGEMSAAGKTVKELRQAIQAELEKTLNNVVVTVVVTTVHPNHISILGGVQRAGEIELGKNWRIVDLITSLGGLVARPQLLNGQLNRNGKLIPLDLTKALSDPNSESNVLLQPNDQILITEIPPPARTQITLNGQVQHPETLEVLPGTTLLQLLESAGGPTPAAALTRAYVQRDDIKIPLNLRPLVIDGEPDDAVQHFKFKDGDILFIPEIKSHFTVLGAVNHAGNFTMPEKSNLTMLDVLNLAGGAAQNAKLSAAEIIRPAAGEAQPIGGTTPAAKPQVIKVDLDKLLKKGDITMNMAILPNDTIYLPQRGKPGLTLGEILAPVTMISVLKNLLP